MFPGATYRSYCSAQVLPAQSSADRGEILKKCNETLTAAVGVVPAVAAVVSERSPLRPIVDASLPYYHGTSPADDLSGPRIWVRQKVKKQKSNADTTDEDTESIR